MALNGVVINRGKKAGRLSKSRVEKIVIIEVIEINKDILPRVLNFRWPSLYIIPVHSYNCTDMYKL